MNFLKIFHKQCDHSSGFDSIYTYDHFLPYYAPNNKNDFFECFTLLSSIAAITSKVKLGQVVTCNSYRNPALLAKMLSTLDIISNGRIELGIGAGWHEEEYRQYGYDFPTTPVYPGSSMYGLVLASGSIEDYALADLYSWLEAHSGLSHPYITTTPASTTGFEKHFSR